MTTPPPLPSIKPPPLPPRRLTIPTWVYCVLFFILFVINTVWAYQRIVARFPADRNPAFAIGAVQGGLLLPLAAIAGIACIWKQNRGFRGIVRVLFWGTVFLLFMKLSQLANLTLQRPNGDADAQAGARLMEQRQFAEAIPHLERALEKPLQTCSRSAVLTGIGNCYFQLNQFEKALEFHKKALHEDPKYHKAFVNMGIAYRNMGDYDKASQCYSQALKLAPDDAELHASMGDLCLAQDNHDKAIEHFERSVKLDDSLAVAHSYLAIAYASVGRFDDAERELRIAVLRGYHQPEVIKERIEQLRKLSDQR